MTKKKVLIVEDNELNLRLFSDLLEMKDIEVLSTTDGSQFIEIVSEFCPDLILMDIQLQGMSGLDLIKEIKTIDSINKIPIIAITAFAMKEDEEKILKSGCEGYISKPVGIEKFFDIIERFLFK